MSALVRFMMVEYAAANPAMWQEIRREAVARHTMYLVYLYNKGLLTKEIIEDHKRLIKWYYDEDGWKMCQCATPALIEHMWGDT